MDLTDAIKSRHSVRTYLDNPIEMAKNHSITSSGNPRHRSAQCRQRALQWGQGKQESVDNPDALPGRLSPVLMAGLHFLAGLDLNSNLCVPDNGVDFLVIVCVPIGDFLTAT